MLQKGSIFVKVPNQEKIIVISDLTMDILDQVNFASTHISNKPNKIILLYSYQIPNSTSQSVIEVHDSIKEKAQKSLSADADKIRKKHGIETDVVLSIGKTYNSVQRLLRFNKDINWITGKSEGMAEFEKYALQQSPHVKFAFEYNDQGSFLINLSKMGEEEIFDFLMILARFQEG